MSIGETLADAREQAGLSVLQVSERTRIRPSIIRNIEADDYSECGGDFYARGDIRSIAEVVGADPMPLIQQYDRAYRAPGPASAANLDELLRASARPQRPHRPGRLVVLGLALVVAAGVGGFFLWAYHPGSGGSGTPVAANSQASRGQAGSGQPGSPAAASSAPASAAPSPSPSAATPTPPAHPRVRVMTPASATALGPYRNPRGDDPQNAHLAIDGRPSTAWQTAWYTTPQFGNLYRGTGLLLDMGHKVTITAVRVLLGPAAGAHFAIRVGLRPQLADLRPVARSAGPGGMVYLKVTSRPRVRYVLVWFTRLPPNAAGNFQVAVHAVRVRGWH